MDRLQHGEDDPAQQLVDRYSLIRQLITDTAQRHGLRKTEREDFESWVWVRFVERDFHILRSFAGRSSLRTYLRVVLGRCLLDFRIAQWGKWRPSAAAKRLGKQAIALERLVTRDGVSADIAAARTGISPTLLPRLGKSARPRIDQPLALAADAPARPETGPEEWLLARDRQAAADELARALAQVLKGLSTSDYELLWLRYGAKLSVPAIATRLGEQSKTLYTKFDRLHATLRVELERLGITHAQTVSVIGAADVWFQRLLDTPRHSPDLAARATHPRGVAPPVTGTTATAQGVAVGT
jgi:RNA polymerase sigma factor (sigma-70 family)